jgi:glucose/arabinose dehydrogenase
MSTAHVAALLVSYCAFTGLVLTARALRRSVRSGWIEAGLGLCLLILAVSAASFALRGQNSVVYLARTTLQLDRTHMAAVVLGICMALLASLALQYSHGVRARRLLAGAMYAASVAVLAVLTSKDQLSAYLVTPDAASAGHGMFERSVVPGFRSEEVATLQIAPTSLALDSLGQLYVAGYTGLAHQNGVVVRLERDSSGVYREVTVAGYLNRPHGIAFHDGELYISRAGQYTRALHGRIVQENTGTLTRARDLDGDGVYEYYEDVITGLPGAQQPDGMHQNNGIAFDSDGHVYVTVGHPTDRGPARHPYAGTIIRARPDGSDVTIFARGLRNPYDLVVGPDGSLFCTDNDSDATNPGDAIYHVEQDAHYGFPYTALGPGTNVIGATKPLLRSSSALEGISYVPSGGFPSGYDNCLYVASFGDGHINRIRLERSDTGYRAAMDTLARVPAALDVIFGADGALYACSYEQRKIYRIAPE